MIRYILMLLINVIVIFGANEKCCANHALGISQNNPHHSTDSEIESTQISMVSFGIIEGNDILTDRLTVFNKYFHYGTYSLYRHNTNDFTSRNINLLTFRQKDIHFLSVLLI